MKLNIEYYGEKYSLETDDDQTINKFHELWVKALLCMGFTKESINELYDDEM